ncbi:hypothetical protein [Achromobacter sp. AONIH1]|uniref:hypothetical protein n=1 Tax=Achromobacter sp. AONIH1 TaxID=1758194 RepID=UPI00131A137D|nr:hypothetical protein [Achromobacter sp. AONIH1]
MVLLQAWGIGGVSAGGKLARGAPPCLPAQVELSNRPVTDARMLSRFIQESTRNLCDFVKFYPSSRSPNGRRANPGHLPFLAGLAGPAAQDEAAPA